MKAQKLIETALANPSGIHQVPWSASLARDLDPIYRGLSYDGPLNLEIQGKRVARFLGYQGHREWAIDLIL
jgi:hypothetical protein